MPTSPLLNSASVMDAGMEIRDVLARQCDIHLCEGSIANLCDRFLVSLEALHLAPLAQLRAALGWGYPMQINATREHGKDGLFVCMDGWHGWVLVAGRIPSEHEEHLRPLVEETTRLFGNPIAIVRNMGKGRAKAVAALREQGPFGPAGLASVEERILDLIRWQLDWVDDVDGGMLVLLIG